MAFASLDLLAVVKASFCSTHLRGLHRLTIQTPRRRMFVPFLAFSDAGAYRIMHADPHTGAFPGSEVMIDTLPLGEIDRQHAPLDAPFRHIKDGIEHRAHTQGARSSTTFGGGNQIFDPLPLLVREVAWIYFFVHLHILHNLRRLFRQALSWWAYIRVRGLCQDEQGIKASVDPGESEVQEMVETVLTPAHPDPLETLLNTPFASTFDVSTIIR